MIFFVISKKKIKLTFYAIKTRKIPVLRNIRAQKIEKNQLLFQKGKREEKREREGMVGWSGED